MSDTDRPAKTENVSFQPKRFMWLYALAWAGGAIAYVPFLSILLPSRVIGLAGDDGSVTWLATLAFFGAIFASVGNIAFAWASDLTKSRTVWILSGLVLSSLLMVTSQLAHTLPALVAILAVWQLALNMMLGPLAAWAGDNVPDDQKGQLGGLLAVAPALAAATAALVTIPGLASDSARLVIVAAIVIACVLPVIVFGKPIPQPQLMRADPALTPAKQQPVALWGPVAKMWLARLLVQISEAALFTFLLVWLQSINSAIAENDAARVLTVVLVIAIPVTMAVGRWADRKGRVIKPLWIAATIATGGLLIMAFAQTLPMAIGGYLVFAVAGAVFLAQHSAQTLRVLPKPETRGRDLGFFNLTNTVPSLVMPGITLALVPKFGFFGLFIALAILAGLSALLLFSFSLRRRRA